LEGKGSLDNRRYSAYIFDLDGTLFALPIDWQGVRTDLSRLSGESLKEKPVFEIISALVRTRPEIANQALSIIESCELKSLEEAEPIAGALELVGRLAGVSRLALVTLQGKMACRRVLTSHGVIGLFETMVTREDSLDRADQLQIALKRLGVPAEKVLFVGDRLNDVVSAKRANVAVALVGKTAPGSLGPDYQFSNMSLLGENLARRA